MKPPMKPYDEIGRGSPSLVVPSSGGPKEFSLSLNATQPTEEYYISGKTGKYDPNGVTSPPNQGGRESSK